MRYKRWKRFIKYKICKSDIEGKIHGREKRTGGECRSVGKCIEWKKNIKYKKIENVMLGFWENNYFVEELKCQM